jgi:hypothetical protein
MSERPKRNASKPKPE